jgi:hypothetical protein
MLGDLDLDTAKAKIAEFYAVGLEFDKVLSRLNALRAVAMRNPAMLVRFDDLTRRGASVKGIITSAAGKVRDVYAWVKENLGVNLGAVWFIPIAIIGGIIAAIGAAKAWMDEAKAETRRLEIIAALPREQQAQALATAAQSRAPTLGENVQKTVMWIAIGAIAVFVMPKLLENLRRK